jgi:hypothetical protein
LPPAAYGGDDASIASGLPNEIATAARVIAVTIEIPYLAPTASRNRVVSLVKMAATV